MFADSDACTQRPNKTAPATVRAKKNALQEEHEYEYGTNAKKWENAGKNGRNSVAGRGGDGTNKTLNSLSGSHSKRTFEFTANKQIMCIFCAQLTTICFHFKFHSLPGTRRHSDDAVRFKVSDETFRSKADRRRRHIVFGILFSGVHLLERGEWKKFRIFCFLALELF